MISFEDTILIVWYRIRSLILDKKLKLVIKKGQPILNQKGLIEEAPNFPKAKEYDVFLRGSGTDSTGKLSRLMVLKSILSFIGLREVIWLKC